MRKWNGYVYTAVKSQLRLIKNKRNASKSKLIRAIVTVPYWVFFSADSPDVVYSSIIVTLFGSVVQISGGPTLHGNLFY